MSTQHHEIIGSWRIDLSPDAQPSVNRAMVAFGPGGILISSSPSVESFPLAEDGAINVSTGLGAWTQDGEGDIELGLLGQATTSKGVLVGFGSMHATVRIDRQGGAISGRYHFEIAGPDDIVFATEDGTVRGIRISATSPERARYLPTAVAAT